LIKERLIEQFFLTINRLISR